MISKEIASKKHMRSNEISEQLKKEMNYQKVNKRFNEILQIYIGNEANRGGKQLK